MLEKSKKDGDADREIYAKFKCYCDTNEQEKTEQIAELTKDISLFESKIEELQGSSGELSVDRAKIKERIAAIKLALKQAQELRETEAEAYQSKKFDLETAIGQMKNAIDTLTEIGADQTLENAVGADHTKFMADYKPPALVKLQARVKQALMAIYPFVVGKPAGALDSFLQKPFTGTYTAQSGEVVGILKDMRDTFKSNLATATDVENKAIKAYAKFTDEKQKELNLLEGMDDTAKVQLAKNDEDLATKKSELSSATQEKSVREDFLAELRPLCERKAKEYQTRNELRTNEDAAISEAIAILGRDASFEDFDKVATTGADSSIQAFPILMQLEEAQQHAPGPRGAKLEAQRLLRAAVANAGFSQRLARVAALLEADNPFYTVLDEINNMLALIRDEGKLDEKELAWCNDERARTTESISQLNTQITNLESKVTSLTNAIEEPEEGLKAQIESTEEGLRSNLRSQKEETELRTQENLAYQSNIDNIVKTQSLLSSAIVVLNKYYNQIVERSGLPETVDVLPGETEARPTTWEAEKGYKGQAQMGRNVISMLQYIQDEVKKEENLAHQDEESDQHNFEDSMKQLKGQEATMETDLARLQETLATTQEDLLQAQDDLKETKKAKAAAEAYLAKIKPGCDFITANIGFRNTRRETETEALTKAAALLKDTPVYKAAVAEEDLESLGPCRTICEEFSRPHVKCQACLAKVTIPGYCAGHPETLGC